MHNVAMWILGLFVMLIIIWILVSYWQFILIGLIIGTLVARKRRSTAKMKPGYSRQPVQSRPVARSVQTGPKPGLVQTRPRPKSQPAGVMPAPEYLPRWTPNRRLDADREHAQWQKRFDNTAQ